MTCRNLTSSGGWEEKRNGPGGQKEQGRVLDEQNCLASRRAIGADIKGTLAEEKFEVDAQ